METTQLQCKQTKTKKLKKIILFSRYLSKLCQGSKGPCISFQGSWLTPNEFQYISGRETAKVNNIFMI